jgi:hypothetical protein
MKAQKRKKPKGGKGLRGTSLRGGKAQESNGSRMCLNRATGENGFPKGTKL